MIGARLPLAAEVGFDTSGRIAVFAPAVGVDLSALASCEVISPLRPVHDHFEAMGLTCRTAPEGRYDAAVVCVPRAKAEAHALIADACAVTEGAVVIDGQKTDGIDSLRKEMRNRSGVTDAISKAHGKLFWIQSSDAFTDWAQGPVLTDGGFWTAPGVFSADGIDPASEMLAAALPEKLGKQVADLGAGWGFLSAHILTRSDVEAVHLVEAHHLALECARRNVTDPRAQYHWADAIRWTPPGRIDTVVMNPPFHTTRNADPSLGQAFVAAAARVLTPQGSLWMVANRHLPYETALEQQFARVEEVGGDGRFKLTRATKPRRRT
ncbi:MULTISPECIES: class I SAM-dependent methyltransferase [Roseobacteraceae]|uniref:Ribosomal RNA small subunit methyltransferase C n=1 Tax=Pseudosulfitobacter pseudonitzschiae TaxID=1402135 RepID=A0A221K3G9_9RHOB|nr:MULTISPECIES: class I SAM-dependent methyltransferase [Roseobacteraceae]ASM73554.1 ribosomal RNA small subunit methyltransferase C [Pseudosulfitobacter pseudonitzschiae]